MIVEFEDFSKAGDNKTYDFKYVVQNDGTYEPIDDSSVRLVRFKEERKLLFFRQSYNNATCTIENIPKKHYWHDQLFTKVYTKIIVR